MRVEVRLDHLDVVHQLRHALQGVVLALDGDQHLGRGNERVDRQQAQRRRAVDEHVVEVGALEFGQRVAQPVLAGHHADEFDLGAGQVDGGGHAEQQFVVRTPAQRGMQRDLPDQHLVGRRRSGLPVFDPQRRAGIALRIEVDHQRLESLHGQCRRQVHRGRRLTDAALLIGDGEHPAATSGGAASVGVQHLHRALGGRTDRGVVLPGRRPMFHVKHSAILEPVSCGACHRPLPPSSGPERRAPARSPRRRDHHRGRRIQIVHATFHHPHLRHAQRCHRALATPRLRPRRAPLSSPACGRPAAAAGGSTG